MANNLPNFLYEDSDNQIILIAGDQDVTSEYYSWLESQNKEAEELPSFLYICAGSIFVGSVDGTDVTNEWESWLESLEPNEDQSPRERKGRRKMGIINPKIIYGPGNLVRVIKIGGKKAKAEMGFNEPQEVKGIVLRGKRVLVIQDPESVSAKIFRFDEIEMEPLLSVSPNTHEEWVFDAVLTLMGQESPFKNF